MASFREHIAFSSLLGVGYGAAATMLFEFTPQESILAGFLAGFGGMLPDLDSPTGKPGQEIFALTAAVSPLVLIGHALYWTGLPPDTETVILLMIAIYFSVRYGLAWLVNKMSVHRGMFHSIPAMLISAEIAYLAYPSDRPIVKLLMGTGIALGFFSHLFLDEVYSIKWGPIPQLKKSFGTAIKFTGSSVGPTAFTYALLATLTYFIGEQTGLIGPPLDAQTPPMAESLDQDALGDPTETPTALRPIVQEAAIPEEELTDAPLYR